MRHMLLAYNKLSFSQVYKLYKSLQHYYHSHFAKPTDGQMGLPVLVADDSDMDLTSTECTVGDRMDKEELDIPLHESELQLVMPTKTINPPKVFSLVNILTAECYVCFRSDSIHSRGPLSQKQAEYFLARQVGVEKIWPELNQFLRI